MTKHSPKVTDAKVIITGQTDNHPITVKGNLKNFAMSAESEDSTGPGQSWCSKQRYFLEFEPDNDGVAYTLSTRLPRDIERIARIDIADSTVAAVEEARTIVGAPVYARFKFDGSLLRYEGAENTIDGPRPRTVIFFWREHV